MSSSTTTTQSDTAQAKTRFTRQLLVTNVSLVNLTVACVPVKHQAALNLRSFLHGSVFTLLAIEGHNVFPHFNNALVKARFTRESLVTNVPLGNLTVACAPEKNRAAFSLRSFLHENVFILLFIESHGVLLHFDIALVKTRCMREPLVTTVALLNLTAACP